MTPLAVIDLDAGHGTESRVKTDAAAPGGLATFMSWERLAEMLGNTGRIMPDERVRFFVIELGGISIRIERR